MFTVLVSLIIVWSEVTFSIARPQLSVFAIIVYTSHQNSSYAGVLVSERVREGLVWVL